MADVTQCRSALDRLAASVDTLSPELRTKHLPRRTIACRVKDLDTFFMARIDEDGIHDIVEVPRTAPSSPQADVKVTVASDDLIALADGNDDFVAAWLHGRVQVSAPMRDMLRLRSVLGL
jgi:predicted lipid carrier protein YhbT